VNFGQPKTLIIGNVYDCSQQNRFIISFVETMTNAEIFVLRKETFEGIDLE
jgi:hypothetical protein